VFFALGSGRAPRASTPTAAPKPMVEVAAVQRHERGIDFEVDGVVIPFREVEVPAEVAGRIAVRSESCRIGHTVKRDELLVKIDPQDYDLEVRRLDEQKKQAEAERFELNVEIEAQKRQIELAREDLTIKKREVGRYKRIESPGVYSQAELDESLLKELQSRDALQTEIDQLELLEARRERLDSACELAARQLEKARLDLSRTEIRSPIEGVITQEPIEQGCYVQRGGIVAVIQDTSCMEIRCSLQMKEMHWLWQSPEEGEADRTEHPYRFPATPVTVVYDMESARFQWEGVLQYYDGGKVDERTRMVPCRVRVGEPSRVQVESPTSTTLNPPALMAGLFVTVEVHSRPKVPLLRLPEAAVQPGGTVWTVEEGRLHELPVRVAYATPENAIAYGDGKGLAAGDLVVVSPLAVPTENAPVSILGEE